jgi:hypothetical protein
MNELPIPDIDSHVEWLLAFNLKVNEVRRLEIRCGYRLSNPSEIMGFARERKTHRMTVDIVDKPATIKPLRCGPAEAIGSPQQREGNFYDAFLIWRGRRWPARKRRKIRRLMTGGTA